METVRTELAEPPGKRLTVPGLKDTVGPLGTRGETNEVSDTPPEKPVLFRVRIEGLDEPATNTRLVALAETVKFPITLTVTAAE